MKTVNFILNQLGFIVAVGAAVFVYQGYVSLSFEFFVILSMILLTILFASQAVYRNLRK